jgi:hypothetical protein
LKLVLLTAALRCKQNRGAISPAGGIRQRGVSAGKRRFFEKKRAKNFIRLATSGGRRGPGLQTPQGAKRRHEIFGAKRRHEVFLLLFVHKKKTFLASLRCASARSATRAQKNRLLPATPLSREARFITANGHSASSISSLAVSSGAVIIASWPVSSSR